MSEKRVTRDEAKAEVDRLTAYLDLTAREESILTVATYFEQLPDADAMWDEIDTLLVKLSRRNSTTHYAFRCPDTKLFGVEIGAGANATNVMSPGYTLPQLLDHLREMDEPPVPTLEDFEAVVDSLTAGREVTCSDAETMARFIAALREKEKAKKGQTATIAEPFPAWRIHGTKMIYRTGCRSGAYVVLYSDDNHQNDWQMPSDRLGLRGKFTSRAEAQEALNKFAAENEWEIVKP